jgi:hypothetical protein
VTGGKPGLSLHQLRPQGLVSCGTTGTDQDAKGICVTHLFRMPGKGLRLNVDASYGVLEAELLDDQDRPIPGFKADQAHFEGVDDTALSLKWRNSDLSQLQNRLVRLGFFLQRAKLYALTEQSP